MTTPRNDAGENSGPGRLPVNVGSTKLEVASVAAVARAAPLPSALNSTIPCRTAPRSSDRPTMPLQVIITAARTVSRANEVSGPPESIKVMISATSMTVTATARTSDPQGSPTRWATTSGVVHRGEHRSAENQRDDRHHHRSQIAAPGERARRERENGHHDDPGQWRSRAGHHGGTLPVLLISDTSQWRDETLWET